jgi:hypothetical protein
VVEAAVDAGTGDHARAGAASGVSTLKEQGATRQPVAGFDVYGGFVGRYFELMLPLARGPYLFGLHVLVPASSAGSAGRLMSELGAAQVRKVPADTPDTARPSDAPAAAGAVVGALIGYLLLANGVGYLRNPLRRKPWRPRSRRLQLEPAGAVSGVVDGATDVSAAAWRSSRVAVARLASNWPAWAWWPTRPTCSTSASGMRTWRPGWWSCGLAAGSSVPPERGAARTARSWPGPYRVLVTVMLVVASAMILFGLAATVAFGLYQIQPPGATVQDLPACRDLACPGWARSRCRI